MSFVASILLNEADNVAILPNGGDKGDLFEISQKESISLNEYIPSGHKVAVCTVYKNGHILKYGRSIGAATADIMPGDWVHTHNLKTCLTRADTIEKRPAQAAETVKKLDFKTFMGYSRASGRPGIRNDIWIVPTVGCVNGEVRTIAAKFAPPPWITGVKVLEHPFGCSQLAEDLIRTADVLAGLAQNPNAAGVLVVGLGCENLKLSMMTERLAGRTTVRFLSMQQPGSDELFTTFMSELAEEAPRERGAFPISNLVIGVKCGGSDGYSGITANPLLGRFTDAFTASGGTVIATEIPEMFGAEEIITSRMNETTFESFSALDLWFRDYFTRNNCHVYENPSPGNISGGITTLEEKSLGAVEKTGNAPIVKILRYGEPAARKPGVQIAFAPGNDIVSCTAIAAGGAHMILFSTGRGTPFGTVIPTLKISSNSELARNHSNWIDFDAGTLIEKPDWKAATSALAKKIIAVANGERSANERKKHGEISLFKDGATL
jgi:altronate hydrolase